jgi:hypothetical protein
MSKNGQNAETLDSMQKERTKFDLAARKSAISKMGGTIRSLGPCVEMTCKPSKKLTKAGKPYRPDLYVRVEYYSTISKNPDANKLALVEWLTRTELGRLVGKKYVEKKEKEMVVSYRKHQEYFQQCKKQGLHPDTCKPLISEELEQYPWLAKEIDSAPLTGEDV